MIIGLYIGLAIVGILALIRGRMQISKQKVVVGVPARLLGLLGLAPLPLALVAGMVYVAANVDVTDPQAVQRFTQEHKWTFTLIEGVCVGSVALVLFVTSAMLAVSPEEAARRARRKRAVEYDDEYEDRDDDRPRRRRDEDYDDEDERPRRRRDDLDDRAR
jgi:hypothetical protein